MATQKVYDGTLKQYVEIEVDNQEEPNALNNKKRNKRSKRNALLAESDWTLSTDSPLTDLQKTEVTTYRQVLRDLPSDADFPNIAFPTKPSFL